MNVIKSMSWTWLEAGIWKVLFIMLSVTGEKKDEIFKADEDPAYEYLIKLPVTIGKDVTKKELELIVSVK